MQSARNYLKKIQQRPYEDRVKILWTATAIIAVVLAVLLGVYFKYKTSSSSNNPDDSQVLESLKSQASDLKLGFSELKAQLSGQASVFSSLPENYQAVTIKDYFVRTQNNLLVINFEVTNPTADILDFLSGDRSSFTLDDGGTILQPKLLQTDLGDPFPIKILGKQTKSGTVVFPQPQSATATLRAAEMFFESQPSAKFLQNITINISKAVPQIKGTNQPRD